MAAANVFLLCCDRRIENDVNLLITNLQLTSGNVIIKTINSVLEAKGKSFGDKLENILSKWAKAVLIICSENLERFIDRKETTFCPEIISQNKKDCLKILKGFLAQQVKLFPNKIIIVSPTNAKELPKILNGMQIIQRNESDEAFHNQVVAIVAELTKS